MADTFTDFMVRMMAGEDTVRKAVLVLHSDDGVLCMPWSPEETPSKVDALGLLRFGTLVLEHDLQESWKTD